jgi:hypothetical protein
VASGGKLEPGAVIAAEIVDDAVETPVGEEGVDDIGDATVAEEKVDDTADAAVGVDVQVDDPIGTAVVADVEDADAGGTGIPGGGDATASGSSISSNGKSGSCSSKGETGTPAKPFGTTVVACGPVADVAAVDEPNEVELAAAEVACDPAVAPVATSSRGIEKSVGEVAAPEEPVAAGLVPVGPAAATEPARAVSPEPTADAFAAGVPPAETPVGLISFLVPVVAVSFDVVLDDGALRGAAPAAPDTFEEVALPVGTPTGLEAPSEAGPDLLAPAPVPVAEPPREAPAEAAPALAAAPLRPAVRVVAEPISAATPLRLVVPAASRPAVPVDAEPIPAATRLLPAVPAEAVPKPVATPSWAVAPAVPTLAAVAPLASLAEFVRVPAEPPRCVVPVPLVPSSRAGAPD